MMVQGLDEAMNRRASLNSALIYALILHHRGFGKSSVNRIGRVSSETDRNSVYCPYVTYLTTDEFLLATNGATKDSKYTHGTVQI